MIPNLINTAIGIWLVYAAVLNPSELGARMAVFASGIVIFLLAIWAYQGDYLKWPSVTAALLGAAFAIYAGVRLFGEQGLVTFWVALFIGIAIAIVSFWSVLYRQPSAPEYAGAALRTAPQGGQDSSVRARE